MSGTVYHFDTTGALVFQHSAEYELLPNTRLLHRRADWTQESSTGYVMRDGQIIHEVSGLWHRANDDYFTIVTTYGVGIMNTQGDIVVEPKFQSIGEFNEGLAPFWQDGLAGYIDFGGNIVIPGQFQNVLPFENGRAWVVQLNDDRGIINTEGDIIAQHRFDDVGRRWQHDYPPRNYMPVMQNNLWGFARFSDGYIVIPPRFSAVTDFSGNMALAWEAPERAGLISTDGSFIIEPSDDRHMAFIIVNRYGATVYMDNIFE
jgi:hypothetical protein